MMSALPTCALHASLILDHIQQPAVILLVILLAKDE